MSKASDTATKNAEEKATVQRLVWIPVEDDEWLAAQAREKAKARGKATIQDCIRELIRQAREAKAA